MEPPGNGQLIAMVVPETFPAPGIAEGPAIGTRSFAPVNTPTNYLMNLVQQVTKAVATRSGSETKMQNWGLGTANTKSSSDNASAALITVRAGGGVMFTSPAFGEGRREGRP